MSKATQIANAIIDLAATFCPGDTLSSEDQGEIISGCLIATVSAFAASSGLPCEDSAKLLSDLHQVFAQYRRDQLVRHN